MRVAHFLNFAPHAAGIYGTARDMVLAERKVGIDAQAIDYGNGMNAPQRHSRVWCKDGEVETISPDWAVTDADVICRHSAIPQKVFDTHKPIIMPLHGAPEYTFLLEHTGTTRVLKEIIVSAQNPDYKAFITFWPQNVFYWETMLNKKVYYCPPSVDLNFFRPSGKLYDYGNKAGDFNIVITNVWRKEYETPYSVLFAAAKWVKEKHPNARIHVFGVPADNKKYPKNDGPVNRTLLALQKIKAVGHCFRIVPNLDEIYRSADMLVTPHVLASRTVREALASGCPVVGATGNRFTSYTAHPRDIDGFVNAIERCYQDIKEDKKRVRDNARAMAEKEFNLEQMGETMKNIFDEVLNNG
jgi:glycosyltransferase involved in cell wall biosynthesis